MVTDAPVRQFGDAGVLLHGDAGEVGDLLAQAGEAIEQGGFAGVGRTDQRHRCAPPPGAAIPLPPHCCSRGNCCNRSRNPRLRERFTGLDEVSARTFRRLAVSRRSAISEPSTWNTRGSPPGALSPAVMRVPGRKPSSIRRRASSAGKSMRSRMAASPRRRSTRLACGVSGLAVVATQLHHDFSMPESEILVKRPDGLPCFFRVTVSQDPPSAPK